MEEKKAVEINAVKEQNKSLTSELEAIKKQAEFAKQELENVISKKEKTIHDLENEKSFLQNQKSLQEEEFKNKQRQFDNKIREYQAIQEEDSLKIEQFKDSLKYVCLCFNFNILLNSTIAIVSAPQARRLHGYKMIVMISVKSIVRAKKVISN